jgi:transcriptional regulator with XRE-family HTH domain
MRIGAELRRAREQAGLSPEQIAERTKIQLRRIEALENDHFENLPAGIYLDGIVRAYAHEVGINPESLIERVRNERAEAASTWRAGPADLDAFTSEAPATPVRNDAAPQTVFVPSETAPPLKAAPVLDDDPVLDEDPLLDVDVDPALLPRHPEPAPPEHGPGRFVLPLLLLLAAAGLGAYLYLATDRFDGGSASNSAILDNSTTAVAPTPQVNAGAVVRETEVATGTSGPQKEETISNPAPAPARRNHPGPAPSTAAATSNSNAAAAPATRGMGASAKDVSGSWALATHVESSSYQRFEGLQLGYDLQLEQAGNRVTGTGRKVSENGDGIRSRVQTPISVEGTINGERLALTFNERGARRPTQGKFVLLLDDGGTMHGRFSSSAARSSGTVEAHRVTR